MTRRPVNVVHSRANPAIVWLLPAPAGAISTVMAVTAVTAVTAVSIMTTASRCSPVNPASPAAALAACPAMSCGTVRLAVARICSSPSR